MALLFSSDRRFQFWFYAVSHSVLLIRSAKEDSADGTRLDLLFKPVDEMNLRSTFNGLRVSAHEQVPSRGLNSFGSDTPTTFQIETDGYSGHIVAYTFTFNEDEGEYYETDVWSVISRRFNA